MSPEQELHLQRIKYQFSRDVNIKYRKGVEEHGGNLWDMPSKQLLEEAIKEAIDQYVYLSALKDKFFGD